MRLWMKAMSAVLGVLLLAAPAVALCPCDRPAPKKQAPMGCEGTSHCCCGDAASSSSSSESEDCPRAEKSVEAAEIAEKSAEAVPAAVPLPSFVSAIELAAPAHTAPPDGLPPPSHPPHLVLTALLL